MTVHNSSQDTDNQTRAENLRRYIALAWRIYRRGSTGGSNCGLDRKVSVSYDPDRKVDFPPSH